MSWNLFHGRDWPPDPELFTWRSKLLKVEERNDTHVQVNRSLLDEFARVLGSIEWHVALLQEAPPRWHPALAEAVGASGSAITMTSRNSLGRLRGAIADRNPDVIGSSEGGSNQLLVRAPWRIEDVREHTLTDRPERRRMVWARLAGPDGAGVAVANLHGSEDTVRGREHQVLGAAARAVEWAGPLPLVFGGDLNLRPATEPAAFEQLARRFELAPPTGPRAVDHLLVRGLDVIEPPARARPDARELDAGEGRVVRLSDHDLVVTVVGMR